MLASIKEPSAARLVKEAQYQPHPTQAEDTRLDRAVENMVGVIVAVASSSSGYQAL